MDQLLLPLAALACPLGMVLMMFFMGRGMMGGRKSTEDAGSTGDLDALKAESARLDARIADIESRRVSDGVGR